MPRLSRQRPRVRVPSSPPFLPNNPGMIGAKTHKSIYPIPCDPSCPSRWDCACSRMTHSRSLPGSLFRSREEEKLAHLARRVAGDRSLARPGQRLIHILGLQNPKTADVLLGLGVGPVGDQHCAIGLLP